MFIIHYLNSIINLNCFLNFLNCILHLDYLLKDNMRKILVDFMVFTFQQRSKLHKQKE